MISAAAYRSGLLEQRIETTCKVVSILIGSAPIAVWFIINLYRQAPGQARCASLSAERSAGWRCYTRSGVPGPSIMS